MRNDQLKIIHLGIVGCRKIHTIYQYTSDGTSQSYSDGNPSASLLFKLSTEHKMQLFSRDLFSDSWFRAHLW